MHSVTTDHHNAPTATPLVHSDDTLPSTKTPVLQLRGLHVPFGPVTSRSTAPGSPSVTDGLHDLSLSIAHGERVVLLGPSGEGKTTLLRAVAGLSPIAGGTVHVNGRDVSALAPEARSTVYLHQVPVLFPHLSVLDNVAFPLTVRGVGKAERQRAAQLLLDRLRLDDLGSRLPHMLSGGQRHRVALARALSAQPHMLLLDEPLSALDPALRRDVREAIRDAHDNSAAGLLLVTHDLDDATALGDRIAVLLGRSIAQIAPAHDLFARPASREVMRFLGAHQELPGTMHAQHAVSTALGVLPLPTDVAVRLAGAKRVTAGIRTDALFCVARAQQQHGSHESATTVSPSALPPLGSVGFAFTPLAPAVQLRVEQVHTRASGSTATVRTGELVFEASINPLNAPRVGDLVALHVDARGIVAYAE